ncbi:MAG: Gfo/Idh/MocA family oxidoreductase [Candidatus Omnitrophota bacterium]
MRFLVIGAGSIGTRHIKNLLYLKQKVAVCEPDNSRRRKLSREFGIETYKDLQTALERGNYDAAVIANPTVYHVSSAIKAAERGLHLFIEKPLSGSLEGVDKLIKLVRRKKLCTFIGSNWKFHPRFKRLKKLLDEKRIGKVLTFSSTSGGYLPDLRPDADYRRIYSAKKSLGGGVILDTHQFDYVQWLLGDIRKISCFSGKRSNLKIDTEDVADTIVELKGGITGGIHVDYIQQPWSRVYFFYGNRGCIEYSDRDGKLDLYDAGTKKWRKFNNVKKNYDSNNMFINEMKHFINVLKGKERAITDIHTAKQALKVAEAAKTSSARGRAVNIPGGKK